MIWEGGKSYGGVYSWEHLDSPSPLNHGGKALQGVRKVLYSVLWCMIRQSGSRVSGIILPLPKRMSKVFLVLLRKGGICFSNLVRGILQWGHFHVFFFFLF